MRGKFAGIFENRIRNLQITFKETSVQPQSERDNNRRRQWEQVAGRWTGGIPMGILPSASIEKNKYEYKYKKRKGDSMNTVQAENIYTFEDKNEREEKLKKLIIEYIKKQTL